MILVLWVPINSPDEEQPELSLFITVFDYEVRIKLSSLGVCRQLFQDMEWEREVLLGPALRLEG